MSRIGSLPLCIVSCLVFWGGRIDHHQEASAASLDKELIRRVIRSHINEVKKCYETSLAKKPNLEGKVIVRFTLNPKGVVTQAEVSESTLSDNDAETCILSAIRTWKFPQAPAPTTITYPFAFKSAE